eukprot:2765347-Pyramimonas_sp.AAC.1
MIWAYSGPPGNLLDASWAVWGLSGRRVDFLGGLGGILDPLGPSWKSSCSWAVLEANSDHLGRTWRPSWDCFPGFFGRHEVIVGAFGAILARFLGPLGPSEGREEANVNILQQQKGNQ